MSFSSTSDRTSHLKAIALIGELTTTLSFFDHETPGVTVVQRPWQSQSLHHESTLSHAVAGWISSGTDRTTLDVSVTDHQTVTNIDSAPARTEQFWSRDTTGGVDVSVYSKVTGTAASTVTLTADQTLDQHRFTTVDLGEGGVPITGQIRETLSADNTSTTRLRDVSTLGSEETVTDTNLLGDDVTSVVYATSRRSEGTSARSLTDTVTASGEWYALGTMTLGSGGTLSGGSQWSTLSQGTTAHPTWSLGGDSTITLTNERWVDLYSDAYASDLTQTLTNGYTLGESAGHTASLSSTGTLVLGAGGTVSGGNTWQTLGEIGGTTRTLHETASDTVNGRDQEWYVAAYGTTHYIQDNLSGTGTRVADREGGGTSTQTLTRTESLAPGGWVAGGNQSVSFRQTAHDTLSLTLSSTVTNTGTAATGMNLTFSDVAMTTESLTQHTASTLGESGSTSWGASGTLLGGSATGTVESYLDIPSQDGTFSTTETATDTADSSNRSAGSVTGTMTHSETASHFQFSSLTFGTGGTITGGGMFFDQMATGDDWSSAVETGTLTVADAFGGPDLTAPHARNTVNASSFSVTEAGNTTLTTGGDVAAGATSFTWSESDRLYSTLAATGTGLTIGEFSTDSFSQQMTGSFLLGASGSIVGGGDVFTWDQKGTNTYAVRQAGTGSHAYTFNLTDSVAATWHDVGSDSLGADGAIVAGTDAYTWDKVQSMTLGLVDRGVSGSSTDPSYTLSGSGFQTASLHIVGGDTLAGSLVTGHDAYTWDESDSYTSGFNYNHNQTSLAVGGTDDTSVHAVGTLANDGTDSLAYTNELISVSDRHVASYDFQRAQSDGSGSSTNHLSEYWSHGLGATLSLSQHGTSSLSLLNFTRDLSSAISQHWTAEGTDPGSLFTVDSHLSGTETLHETGWGRVSDGAHSYTIDDLNYANGSYTITGNEAGTPFFESRHGLPTTVSMLRHGDNYGDTFDVSLFWWDSSPTVSGSTPSGIPAWPPPSGPWVESNIIVEGVLTGGEGLPAVARERLERPLVHTSVTPDPAALAPQETVDGRFVLLDGTSSVGWLSRPDPIGYRRPGGCDPGGGDPGGSGGGDSGGGDSGGSGGFDLVVDDLDDDNDGWPTAEQLGAVRWEARPRLGPPAASDDDAPDDFLSSSLDSGGGDSGGGDPGTGCQPRSMAVRTGGGSFTGLTAEQQADVLAFLLGAQPDAESQPKSSGASTGDPTSPQELAAQGPPPAAPTGFFQDVIDGFVVGGMIKGKDTWGIALGEAVADFTPWSKVADARNAAAAAKSVWDGDPNAGANVVGVALGAIPGSRMVKKAAGSVKQAGGWVAGKIKGVASGLWDRYSGRATKGAGAAGEGSIKAVATNSKFPETGFSTEINSGRGITQFNTSFKGVDNNGVLQTTFTKNTGDLYIDVIRSEVQREGLGEAMLRKTIAEVESKAGPVKTLSGNLEGVNRTEFLKGGLESTPAYKQRQALGFTEVIVTPSKENGFTLVMRKPG